MASTQQQSLSRRRFFLVAQLRGCANFEEKIETLALSICSINFVSQQIDWAKVKNYFKFKTVEEAKQFYHNLGDLEPTGMPLTDLEMGAFTLPCPLLRNITIDWVMLAQQCGMRSDDAAASHFIEITSHVDEMDLENIDLESDSDDEVALTQASINKLMNMLPLFKSSKIHWTRLADHCAFRDGEAAKTHFTQLGNSAAADYPRLDGGESLRVNQSDCEFIIKVMPLFEALEVRWFYFIRGILN
ncbi:hypothetical protein PG997_014913 [Apiospora hydei]|uniref:Uncharacterized protein n=1 Tax=Apiospora hydei TaxID=1337664 RepID=A0ABR1UV56_9PEZI